jgi:hypothetical protein
VVYQRLVWSTHAHTRTHTYTYTHIHIHIHKHAQDTVEIVMFNVLPQLVDIVAACTYLAAAMQVRGFCVCTCALTGVFDVASSFLQFVQILRSPF